MKLSSEIHQIIVYQSRIDASQLYPFSMCQDMPTELYTRWDFDTDRRKFKARHNRSRNFENMIMSFYQEKRPDCKIESFSHLENRRKLTVLMFTVIVITVRHGLKQWDATTISVPVKKPVPL